MAKDLSLKASGCLPAGGTAKLEPIAQEQTVVGTTFTVALLLLEP
ncbi:hypothetical protein [Lyngbya aestuarii]